LIKPYSGDDFEMYAVGQDVNNARNERPDLDQPLDDPGKSSGSGEQPTLF
jgi:hypothetical protein